MKKIMLVLFAVFLLILSANIILAACSDSDNGINSTTPGYTSNQVHSKLRIMTDSCSTSNILIERYCSNGKATYTKITCPGICNKTASTAIVSGRKYNLAACQEIQIQPQSICGNNVLDTGEQCDSGSSNGLQCTPQYNSTCQYCDSSCKIQKLTGGSCGDNVINGAEKCDSGSTNGVPCSPAYNSTCQYCTAQCQFSQLKGGYCGDKIITSPETCDNSSSNGISCNPLYNSTCQYCDSSCKIQKINGGICGDNIINGAEQCDSGSTNGVLCNPLYNSSCKYCDINCKQQTIPGPYCGDNIINGQEKCDSSLTNTPCTPASGSSCSYCNLSCNLVQVISNVTNVTKTPICGNNIIEQGEQCDNNATNGIQCTPLYNSTCQYCTSQCQLSSPIRGPYCGDKIITSPETCDNSSSNGILCNPLYNSSCKYCDITCRQQTIQGPYCGDNKINGTESCDSGGLNTNTPCTPASGSSCSYCNLSCNLVQVISNVTNTTSIIYGTSGDDVFQVKYGHIYLNNVDKGAVTGDNIVLYGLAGNDKFVTVGNGSQTIIGGDGLDTYWIDSTDSVSDLNSDESQNTMHNISYYSNDPTNSSYISINSNGEKIKNPDTNPGPKSIGWWGDPLLNYTNFASTPLFIPQPNYYDVYQRNIGDCHILSVLSSLANENPMQLPDVIKQTITEIGDGNYIVRFYKNNVPIYLKINADLPTRTDDGSVRYAQISHGLWPALLEKAFAYYYSSNSTTSSYSLIGNGGTMNNIYPVITNQGGNTPFKPSDPDFLNKTQILLASQKAPTIGSVSNAQALCDYKTNNGHAFSIIYVNSSSQKVYIYNGLWNSGREYNLTEISTCFYFVVSKN